MSGDGGPRRRAHDGVGEQMFALLDAAELLRSMKEEPARSPDGSTKPGKRGGGNGAK